MSRSMGINTEWKAELPEGWRRGRALPHHTEGAAVGGFGMDGKERNEKCEWEKVEPAGGTPGL